MARVFNNAKTDLQGYSPYSRDISSPQARSKDINEFIISTINPETGEVLEKLQLSETHLPFQPIITPVTQDISTYYYPGGQANRVPTVQILGSMDNDVRLKGRFKSTKILDIQNREEPLTMSRILTRFVKEGNVCFFVLGTWLKYGIITNFTPTYKTDSDIEWELTIFVIGDTNPFNNSKIDTGDFDTPIAKVFSDEGAVDIGTARDSIQKSVEESKNDLEGSYLPTIAVPEDFTIKQYLSDLSTLKPVGDVIEVGNVIYDNYLEILGSVDRALDIVEEFDQLVTKTSYEVTKTINNLTSQINRLYAVQENLFVSYANVSNSLKPFQRLGSYSAISLLGQLSNSILFDLSSIEGSLNATRFSNVLKTYVANSRDTYQSVSTKFYGTWERWEEIRTLNGYEGDLQGGEILIIPS